MYKKYKGCTWVWTSMKRARVICPTQCIQCASPDTSGTYQVLFIPNSSVIIVIVLKKFPPTWLEGRVKGGNFLI